ncbi:hypothetical protein HNP60_001220 [Sphingobium sp. B1D3A]|uniref:Uncharacterized protein n=1 Tax=Sphingobium lignivorans TaxID=2735886 RepID=A0ABR6NDB4_9SPHN|nr:hypothetical protein [Sphingobium lignivorans]
MSRLSLTALGLMAICAGMSDALLAQGTSPARPAPPRCTPELVPPAQKAAMEGEYSKRKREDGKAKADAWLRNETRALLTRLVDDGVCTVSLPNKDRAATPARSTTRKAPLGKDGKPCKHTRMENRNIANVGGGPMVMVLVPVCAD